jgi:hypothetical protein
MAPHLGRIRWGRQLRWWFWRFWRRHVRGRRRKPWLLEDSPIYDVRMTLHGSAIIKIFAAKSETN